MWKLLKTTWKEWNEDEASLLAAALAYYTAVSIAPLLVLVVVIVGFFLGQQAAQSQLMTQLQGAMGKEGSQFLATILQNADQPKLASAAGILSFVTLIWGSTNLFAQLQNSLNKIWNVKRKPGGGIWATIRSRLLSFTMVLGVAFMLLVSLVIGTLLTTVVDIGHGLLPGADLDLDGRRLSGIIWCDHVLVCCYLQGSAGYRYRMAGCMARGNRHGVAVHDRQISAGTLLGKCRQCLRRSRICGSIPAMGLLLGANPIYGRRVHPGVRPALRQRHPAR